MVEQRKKKQTNWREKLMRHGKKVLQNPLKYALLKAEEYSKDYEKNLKYRLRKKHKILFPNEYQ